MQENVVVSQLGGEAAHGNETVAETLLRDSKGRFVLEGTISMRDVEPSNGTKMSELMFLSAVGWGFKKKKKK